MGAATGAAIGAAIGTFFGEAVGFCRLGATNEGSAGSAAAESCSQGTGAFVSTLLGAGLASDVFLTGDFVEGVLFGAICPVFCEVGCFVLSETFSVRTLVSWLVLVTGGSLSARSEPTAKARISNFTTGKS